MIPLSLPKLSPVQALTLVVILTLGLCRIGLNASFWFSLAAQAGSVFPAVFLVVGICFTFCEILGLTVWEERREADPGAAKVWLALWSVFVGLNLIADMGGISTLLARDSDHRAAIVERYNDLHDEQVAADQDRNRYAAALQKEALDLPVSVLQAKHAAVTALIARRGKAGASLNQQTELSKLQTAIALAKAHDEAETRRLALEVRLSAIGAEPEALPPSFAEYTVLLKAAGVSTTPETVHAVIVFLIALVIQATLIVGPWYILRAANRPVSVKHEPSLAPKEVAPSAPSACESNNPVPTMAAIDAGGLIQADVTDKPRRKRSSTITSREIQRILGADRAARRIADPSSTDRAIGQLD